MRTILMLLLSLTMTAVLVGCGAKAAALKPYKMEIQQGNVVTSKMLLQLRPGMTKSQVRYIMGTPLIVDSFHNNRWDYYFQLRQAGKIVQQRRVILDFENELLAHVRGDVVPAGTPGADTSDAPVSKSIAKPKEEKSLVDKLKFWKKDDTPEDKPLASQPALVVPNEAPENLTKPAVQAKPVEPTNPAANTVQPADTQTQGTSTQDAKPSMLAVPIPLIPSNDAPIPTVPPQKPASMPTPEDSSAVQTTPIQSAPVIIKPAAAETPAAASVAKSKAEPATDDNKALTLDHQMDGKAKPAAAAVKPTSTPATKTEQPVEKTKSQPADDQLDPEPGYFERLLEKIGF